MQQAVEPDLRLRAASTSSADLPAAKIRNTWPNLLSYCRFHSASSCGSGRSGTLSCNKLCKTGHVQPDLLKLAGTLHICGHRGSHRDSDQLRFGRQLPILPKGVFLATYGLFEFHPLRHQQSQPTTAGIWKAVQLCLSRCDLCTSKLLERLHLLIPSGPTDLQEASAEAAGLLLALCSQHWQSCPAWLYAPRHLQMISLLRSFSLHSRQST